MTNIDWAIAALDCIPSQDGRENIVKTVHWRCEGEDEGHSGSVYATCTLPPPESDFTLYEDLTKETVLGWIWDNGVNKEATEAAVQSQIDTAKNPPVVQPVLPWSM